MTLNPTELCAVVTSLIGLLTIAQTHLHRLFPSYLRNLLRPLFAHLSEYLSRFSYIEIPEYDDDCPNELYRAVKIHLGTASCHDAPRIKISCSSQSNDFTYTHASNQCIPMCFQGAKVWWQHHISNPPQQQELPRGYSRSTSDTEKRKYVVQVQKSDKARLLTSYMEHILTEAKEIRLLTRERRLYTNNRSEYWDCVSFRHPSTFDTLALDPVRKEEIMADLRSFAHAEHFYRKAGRAWKRGYLLHGPPGTGKSSMIAAMANFLRYDVYDLELTHVRSNGELRKLLWKTTSKSLVVIEDIDCSLNLTNRVRKPRVDRTSKRSSDRDDDEPRKESITLSGLLNFTDGLWSCCGDERIFVFTTNHIEKLDPALLRSGRMDMHILMSYCTFPAFKILAYNYLDVVDHYLFPKVQQAIGEAKVTPAEVSEILVRKRDDPETALNVLLAELEVNKARPWPPPPPKAPVADQQEDAEQMHEEVKKAVKEELACKRDSENEVCPTCLHCRSAHEQEEEFHHNPVNKAPKVKKKRESDEL